MEAQHTTTEIVLEPAQPVVEVAQVDSGSIGLTPATENSGVQA